MWIYISFICFVHNSGWHLTKRKILLSTVECVVELVLLSFCHSRFNEKSQFCCLKTWSYNYELDLIRWIQLTSWERQWRCFQFLFLFDFPFDFRLYKKCDIVSNLNTSYCLNLCKVYFMWTVTVLMWLWKSQFGRKRILKRAKVVLSKYCRIYKLKFGKFQFQTEFVRVFY